MSKAAELAALIGSQTALSNRNLVINGAMQVAQRGTSAATLGTSGQTFRADRFQVEQGSVTANNGTIEVATDAPTGFEYSTKVTAGSSVTFNSTGFAALNYRIEGQDVKQLASGTSSPKSATLSFYVKSSVTGTYSLNITKYDGSTERFYVKTYTINSANTWEYKTVTVENESSYSASEWMRLYWQLGGDSGAYTATAGTFVNSNAAKRGTSAQPDMISTSGATFLLTGVQLEVGETATPFEHRSYGDELAKCQRYFQIIPSVSSYAFPLVRHQSGTNLNSGSAYYLVTMRTNATLTLDTSGSWIHKPNIRMDSGSASLVSSSPSLFTLLATPSTNDTSNYLAYSNNSVEADAEL